MRFRVHGHDFRRNGTCAQCGACGCDECPHHYVQDGKMWCAIYETRDQVCAACSEVAGVEVVHAGCIAYPDNPWILLVRQGVCAHSFVRTDGKSMDDLPFLDDQPYAM